MSETVVLEKHKLTHYIENSPCIKSEHITHIPIMGDITCESSLLRHDALQTVPEVSKDYNTFIFRFKHNPKYEGIMIL
jgi:hypothetical protein